MTKTADNNRHIKGHSANIANRYKLKMKKLKKKIRGSIAYCYIAYGFWNQILWVYSPVPLFITWITLVKSLKFSIPQFFHLFNGDNDHSTYLIWLVWGLNVLICMKHVQQCLAHNRHLVSVIIYYTLKIRLRKRLTEDHTTISQKVPVWLSKIKLNLTFFMSLWRK